MFSFGEILLVVVIGFLLLGPDLFIETAQQIGKWLRKIKDAKAELFAGIEAGDSDEHK